MGGTVAFETPWERPGKVEDWEEKPHKVRKENETQLKSGLPICAPHFHLESDITLHQGTPAAQNDSVARVCVGGVQYGAGMRSVVAPPYRTWDFHYVLTSVCPTFMSTHNL